MSDDRAARTRAHWLDTLARHKRDPDRPGSADYWSPSLDCAGRDELRAIQDAKLAALTPFLYENSAFYRRRFDRLGLLPTALRTVDHLPKWPVVDKTEMMEDLKATPPFGTYTTHDDALWATRGWMMFSSSGSTGVPRVFRYSQIDRELWEWANARARPGRELDPDDPGRGRARRRHRGHAPAPRGSVERTARGVLRLHRGLAPLRRLLLPGLGARPRAGHGPPDGGRADLGAGRRGEPAARRGGRPRPHRLHEPQLRELAAAAVPGRRLHDAHLGALRLRADPHPG